jgi:alkylated DNA nucleotide flippase Atl1
VVGLLQNHKQAWQKRGDHQCLHRKSEHDTSNNEEQSKEQSNSTSSKRRQKNILLKEGVHNLQNASYKANEKHWK